MTDESKVAQIFPKKETIINIEIPKLKYISTKYGKNKDNGSIKLYDQ